MSQEVTLTAATRGGFWWGGTVTKLSQKLWDKLGKQTPGTQMSLSLKSCHRQKRRAGSWRPSGWALSHMALLPL